MKPNEISPAVQSPSMAAILNAYKKHSGNGKITSDELFSLLTSPSAERDLFLSMSFSCTIVVQEDIIYSVFTPL